MNADFKKFISKMFYFKNVLFQKCFISKMVNGIKGVNRKTEKTKINLKIHSRSLLN
jgi:hypothetical protein